MTGQKAGSRTGITFPPIEAGGTCGDLGELRLESMNLLDLPLLADHNISPVLTLCETPPSSSDSPECICSVPLGSSQSTVTILLWN